MLGIVGHVEQSWRIVRNSVNLIQYPQQGIAQIEIACEG